MTMTTEQANTHFIPASTSKRLAGEYITWKCTGTGYEDEGYRLGLVSKKQGDTAITSKFARVPIFKAYIVSIELAARWPQWDDLQGYRRISKDELMSLLEGQTS